MLKQSVLLSIINNPGRSINDAIVANGVTRNYIHKCYRYLNMDLHHVPKHCVGAPKHRQVHVDSANTITARMRRFAKRQGLTFKSTRGGYALFKFRTCERVSGVYDIDYWRNYRG